jgi:hypothetical protein
MMRADVLEYLYFPIKFWCVAALRDPDALQPTRSSIAGHAKPRTAANWVSQEQTDLHPCLVRTDARIMQLIHTRIDTRI